MKASRREVVELWQRAQEALRTTQTLLTAGFPDFAAARAYYAAFYAGSALLLAEGKTFRSHRGVMALIHRDYVRSGRLPVDMGRVLSMCYPTYGASEITAALPTSVTPRPTSHCSKRNNFLRPYDCCRPERLSMWLPIVRQIPM